MKRIHATHHTSLHPRRWRFFQEPEHVQCGLVGQPAPQPSHAEAWGPGRHVGARIEWVPSCWTRVPVV